MKKIILILIMMLFIGNVYCDERQDISTILYPNILNNDLYARNDFLTNKTNYTKSTTKDTVSISPILKRPKGCFTFALDTVVMPGIKIGFGSIKYDSTSTKEKIVVIHGSFGAIWPIFTAEYIHKLILLVLLKERDFLPAIILVLIMPLLLGLIREVVKQDQLDFYYLIFQSEVATVLRLEEVHFSEYPEIWD